MNQTLTQIEKEFDEKFGNTPAIAGKITDSDECCNCGEDLALELYEAFSNGYEMAKDDIRPFLTQSNLRVLEKVKEILKKHRGIYGMGNIDDVYLELSTIIEQK